MKIRTFSMDTEVVTSDDGRNTYEIKRSWSEGGKRAIVIELYPTIGSNNIQKMDLSTMHLLNHAKELAWNEIRIVNLYSTIYDKKPTVSQLKEDAENLAYIQGILEEENIARYDIVIAWGNTMAGNAGTQKVKCKILEMLKKKGMEKQVKHIVTAGMDREKQIGTHSLFLGLRHSKEKWMLAPYPVEAVLKEYGSQEQKPNKEVKKGKEAKADVLQNKEQHGCEDTVEIPDTKQ